MLSGYILNHWNYTRQNIATQEYCNQYEPCADVLPCPAFTSLHLDFRGHIPDLRNQADNNYDRQKLQLKRHGVPEYIGVG